MCVCVDLVAWENAIFVFTYVKVIVVLLEWLIIGDKVLVIETITNPNT